MRMMLYNQTLAIQLLYNTKQMKWTDLPANMTNTVCDAFVPWVIMQTKLI